MNRPRYVYGPVPSRRFGLSLGVDVVPRKTCTYDCVYCQLGPTTRPGIERMAFVEWREVLVEIQGVLARGKKPEVITLAGSGEPTLYRDLGILAQKLKDATDTPLLLITNGSLLWREDVAADAALFDMVAPNLDAATVDIFGAINRPHPDLDLDTIINGIADFARLHPDKVHLEVFLAQGINDSVAELDELSAAIHRVQPAAVYLNSAVRPSPGRSVGRVSDEFLDSARLRLGVPGGPDAVLARANGVPEPPESARDLGHRVLQTLGRRPCTAAQLALSLDVSASRLEAVLDRLVATGELRSEKREDGSYYLA